MSSKQQNIPGIIMLTIKSAEDLPENFLTRYHTHVFCHQGSIDFLFNEKHMTCKSGEFAFWFAHSKLSDIQCSRHCKATVLLVEDQFLTDNIPDQNWGIDATLHSRQYPVKQLTDNADRQRILSNFQLLHTRFNDEEHRFYEEALKLQMRLFILEMWHTFAKEYEHRKRTLQTGTLYERFMHLVQDHSLKKREVQFYANELHITAKYLNAVCKQNSDITASEWIQRFAKERILLLLQNESLNITEIADEMEFSSRSFFTRYVKKTLGFTPTEYRNRMG